MLIILCSPKLCSDLLFVLERKNEESKEIDRDAIAHRLKEDEVRCTFV